MPISRGPGGVPWLRPAPAAAIRPAGMTLVFALSMHPIFFGLKRAYYASLGLTRRTLNKMGLTAARMDMLHVVHRNGRYPLLQHQLWRTLGVCPSVVSRMLKRLEAIGYVRREVVFGKSRYRKVFLTTKGRATILRAIRQFISWGYVELALRSALEPNCWHSDGILHVLLGRFRDYLWGVCVGFSDRADLGLYQTNVTEMNSLYRTELALRWVR